MKKIFYLDQEKCLCRLIEKSLPKNEFEVFTTCDVSDLCQLQDLRSDLILVDEKLIQHPSILELKKNNIYVVTVGFSNLQHEKLFLKKPLAPLELKHKINELLMLVSLGNET